MPESERTRRRYDRIAPVYDASELVVERLLFRGWRRRLWGRVPAGRVLEVGVGTGKNLPFHGPDHVVVGIDLSPGMLARARRRADRLGSGVVLRCADVEELPFEDASFDAAVASFVFCSVPDPIRGLREVRRVLRPGGHLILLEHVVSERPVLGWWMRAVDPIPVRLAGFHVDRDTVENSKVAGFSDVRSTRWLGDVVLVIEGTA